MITSTPSQTSELQNAGPALSLQNVTISYGSFEAVRNVYCDIPSRAKSRPSSVPPVAANRPFCAHLNRMNDLIEGCSLKGSSVV